MRFDSVSPMPEGAMPAVHVVEQTTISSRNKGWRWEGGIYQKFICKQSFKKKKEEHVRYCGRYHRLKIKILIENR